MNSDKLCVNIDWFEVFSHEPPNFSMSVWEDLGFIVEKRDFGTRVYKEVYTLILDGYPWCEVRRCPCSSAMFDLSTHIRLVNRSCYERDAVKNLFDLLAGMGYRYRNDIAIPSRVDICVDFTEFDNGVKVHQFLNDYLAGSYAKINQPRVKAYGTDFIDSKVFHQLSWGSPSSMVSTKIYNKTKEMLEEKNKPYIVQAWFACGLIADVFDETPVWRLEFSISSDCKFWVTEGKGSESFLLQNSFEFYCEHSNLLIALKGLISHYFRFVIPEEGKSKYRCKQYYPITFEGKSYQPLAGCSSRDGRRTVKIFNNFLESLKCNPFLPWQTNDTIEAMQKIVSYMYAPSLANFDYNNIDKAFWFYELAAFRQRLMQIVAADERYNFGVRSSALTLVEAIDNSELESIVFPESRYSITAVGFSTKGNLNQNITENEQKK